MTQNKSGVSTLLLRYQVAGQDQLLKANTAVSLSLKDAEKAAKELGISIERLQELGGARIDALNLNEKPLAAAKELEKAQRARLDVVDDALKSESKITAELKAQADLIQRQSRGIRDIGMQRIPEPSLSDFGVRNTRSVSGALTGIREGLISLPNVGYQNPAVVALRGLIPLVDKTGASFGQLGAALGIAGAAVIGVAIAFDRFNRELEGSKRILNGALAAQENYYQALSDLTSVQADEQAQELQRLRPILQQQATELRNSLESAFSQASQTPLGDVGARALFNQLPTGALKEQLDKVEAALQENIQTEARLTQGREAGVFAANDLREREQQLADARRKASEQVISLVGRDLIDQGQQAARAQTLTQAQREQEQAALTVTIASNNAYLQSLLDIQQQLDPTTEAYKGYQEAIDSLTGENTRLEIQYNILDRATNTAADGVAKFNAAIEAQLAVIQTGIGYHAELAASIRTSTVDQVGDRLNAIEEERRALAEYLPQLVALAPTSIEAANALQDAQSSLTSLSLEFNDQLTRVLPAALSRARAELSADLAQLEADRNDKFAEIDATRLEKEADAAEKRSDAYLTAEEKRADSLNDLAEQQAERRARIEKKSNAEIANAIFARDAMAAYLAMQDREEQLDDLKTDAEKRQREIDKQFEKERQAADRNYERALRDAQQAADKARAAARRSYDIEFNERVTAYNQQLALLRAFAGEASAVLAAGLTVPNLSGLVNGTSGGTSNPPALPNSPYGVPPVNPQVGDTWTDAFGQLRVWNGNGWQIASASRGYSGGVSSAGSGGLGAQQSRAFSSSPAQRVFGGQSSGKQLIVNIPVTGTQLTKREIMSYAAEELSQTLDDAGWDD